MYELIKRSDRQNSETHEYYCDTTSDLQNIDVSKVPMGSVAFIINPSDNEEKLYMLTSDKQWIAQ